MFVGTLAFAGLVGTFHCRFKFVRDGKSSPFPQMSKWLIPDNVIVCIFKVKSPLFAGVSLTMPGSVMEDLIKSDHQVFDYRSSRRKPQTVRPIRSYSTIVVFYQ